MAYTKYSLTPASNTAAPPDGAPEGMLPSAVNDTMRDMMAQIRDCGDGIRNGTYTMTAPVITGGTITGVTDIAVADGGTGASTVSAAQTNLQVFNFKNRLINGDMRIDQRNAGASVSADGTTVYTLDRWSAAYSQNSKYTIQQNAGSVTPPVGFVNYLGCTSSAATTVGASDYYLMLQKIEGLNTGDLGWGTANAKTVTLSFWVRSSLTGTFGGSLKNSAGNRSYPFTYTISSANTWTQISVTVAGDTSGTWLTTNGIGIQLTFSLGSGSTFSGTAGAWAASNLFSATGATNVVSTNGATFYVTGVQLEVGSSASNFEVIDYGNQLLQCQRYFENLKTTSGTPRLILGVATAVSTTELYGAYWYKVSKRATPSVTITGSTLFRTLGPNQGQAGTISSNDVNSDVWFFGMTSTLYVAGQANLVQSQDTATASISWSSEL
jgi:hypothetical protein